MTYTTPTPSTVSAGDTFPASAYNIISNDIQDHESRIKTGVESYTTTQRNALTGVATGTMIYNSTLSQIQTWNGTAWVSLSTYQNRYASYRYTGGDITLTSNATWANIPTIGTLGDLTLNASVGDVIEVGISGLVLSSGVITGWDVVTIVSANPVNSFGFNGAVTTWAAFRGIAGWQSAFSADSQLTGSQTYTLVAGDISAGTVTLRVRYANNSATTRVLDASTINPFTWFAKNLGPVTT